MKRNRISMRMAMAAVIMMMAAQQAEAASPTTSMTEGQKQDQVLQDNRTARRSGTGAPATGRTAANSFVLGNGKLGPIAIGQAVSTLPRSVAGLYDRYQVKEEEFGDEDGTWNETVCFFYKAGKVVFKSGVDDSKQLASFVLEAGSSGIKTSEGFFVGCPAKNVFSKKQMEWETWYTGTTFARDGHWEYHIPSSGLIGVDTPSKLADLKPTAKISMIVYYKNLPEL